MEARRAGPAQPDQRPRRRLGSPIAEAAAAAFNTAMKSLWDFAINLLDGVFAVVDHLTTPDLDPRTGPLAAVLPATPWVGGARL